MIKIVIVEDELIIARDLSNILEKMGYEVMGIAKNFDLAIEKITEDRPDLLLLDINLKGEKDGVELADFVNKHFQIPFIYITSYTDKLTLERVKHTNPLNFIVKPFKKEQLFTTIELAFHSIAKSTLVKESQEDEPLIFKDAVFVKDKYRYTKVNLDDIYWVKSDGNYLELHLENKHELIRSTIDSFLNRINHQKFFRTQKSYIVNLDYITKIETNFVVVGDKEIPLTKVYHDELIKKLNIL